ncbi:MAG: hypothetical protein ACREN1_06625 [Candidatus Dormibacteria bacterium]
MSDDWTPDESWLAGAFDEIGQPSPPNRGQLGSNTPKRGHRMRAAVAVAAVGAVAAAAIVVPRLVGGGPGLSSACKVALPPSWLHAADGHLPGSTTGLTPLVVAPNGKWLFASVAQKAWSGLVEVNLNTGTERQIEEFSKSVPSDGGPGDRLNGSPTVSQGSFDGRWLVWSQTQKLKGGASSSSVLTWDSASDRVWMVAGPFTSFVDPVQDPAGRIGLLALVSFPSGKDARSEVSMYSLRTRLLLWTRPGISGADGAFFWGGMVVVETAKASGRDPGPVRSLRAVSSSTGEFKLLPRPLRALQGLQILAASGRYVVAVRQATISTAHVRRRFTLVVLPRDAQQPHPVVSGTAYLLAPGWLGSQASTGALFGPYLTIGEAMTQTAYEVLVVDLASESYTAFPEFRNDSERHPILSAIGGGATLLALGVGGGPVGVLHLERLPALNECG